MLSLCIIRIKFMHYRVRKRVNAYDSMMTRHREVAGCSQCGVHRRDRSATEDHVANSKHMTNCWQISESSSETRVDCEVIISDSVPSDDWVDCSAHIPDS